MQCWRGPSKCWEDILTRWPSSKTSVVAGNCVYGSEFPKSKPWGTVRWVQWHLTRTVFSVITSAIEMALSFLSFHVISKLFMGICNKNPALWSFCIIKNWWCWEKRTRDGCLRKVVVYFLIIALGPKHWNKFLLPIWLNPGFPNVCTCNLNTYCFFKWSRLR